MNLSQKEEYRNKKVAEDYLNLSEGEYDETFKTQYNKTKKLEGVGKDAALEINRNGGKQSVSPTALHLIDPTFLKSVLADSLPDCSAKKVLKLCIQFMDSRVKEVATSNLLDAMKILEPDPIKLTFMIGNRLKYGAVKYAPNNWRLIPEGQHLNHAMIHLVALAIGDDQDDHLGAALCRLHMTIALREMNGIHVYDQPEKISAKSIRGLEGTDLI